MIILSVTENTFKEFCKLFDLDHTKVKYTLFDYDTSTSLRIITENKLGYVDLTLHDNMTINYMAYKEGKDLFCLLGAPKLPIEIKQILEYQDNN